MAKPTILEPVLIEKAQCHDIVDEDKHYRVVFQLGSGMSWRRYSKGRWQRDPTNDDYRTATSRDGEQKFTAYKFLPAVHEARYLTGKIVNGLTTTSNRWLQANRELDVVAGGISRMLLVVSVKPDDPPKLRPSSLPFDVRQLLTEAASAAATAAVQAMATATGAKK